MEPIAIRYRISESQFMALGNAHWKARRSGTRVNIIAGSVGLAVGAGLLSVMLWLALLVACAGGSLLFITWLRSFLWRRAYRDARKYCADISVVFSEDSIHVESAEGKSELNWSYYTWHLDTPEYVLLYLTKNSFSVIPKAAFPSPAALESFLGLVKTKLEKIK